MFASFRVITLKSTRASKVRTLCTCARAHAFGSSPFLAVPYSCAPRHTAQMDAPSATPATHATTERDDKDRKDCKDRKDRIELLVGLLRGNAYYKLMRKTMRTYRTATLDTDGRAELEQSIVAYRKLAMEALGISSEDFALIHEAVLADERRFPPAPA